MTRVNIIEPDFSHRDCTKYKLLMLVSRGSLSFYVLSPLGRLMALREIPLVNAQQVKIDWSAYLSEIRNILKVEKILHLPFKETLIGVDIQTPMIAPGVNHEDSDLFSAFTHSLPQKDTHSILVTEDEVLDLTYLFFINNELKTILKNFFPFAQIVHGASGMLRYFMLLSDKTRDNLISINISPPRLSISVMHLGRLKFHNEYHITDANDLVYYVMLVNNKLHLKPSSSLYYVTGRFEQEGVYMQQLNRYISDIQTPDLQELITFSSRSMPWSKHYFLDLFALYLCV